MRGGIMCVMLCLFLSLARKDLFCIFPIVDQIMMRNSQLDETGNSEGFQISMVFLDKVNDVTEETT